MEKDNVTTQDIREVEVSPHPPGKQAQDEAASYNHQQHTKKQELGWIGWLIGDKGEKPGNIAFLIVISCFVIIGALYFVKPINEAIPIKEILGFFTNILALTLGYLYGQKNN